MKALDVLKAEHSDLSSYGWRFTQRSPWNDGEAFERNREQMDTADFAKQVETVIGYLRDHRIGKFGSYGLKHKIENHHDRRIYVSNGAAICGALLSGYDPVREFNSPNCKFVKGGN